jgi:membrane-associated protease RseP (regulator of RpoE activity)
LIGSTSNADWSDPTVVGAAEVARDRASQLVVVRLPGGAAPAVSTWAARRPSYPRFLVAADASSTGVSFRPVFVGSLRAVVTPIWSDALWALPDRIDLAPGTFVFTVDGALAGLVVEHDGRPALAPADAVIGMADRMAQEGQRRPGRLGVEVQPLNDRLAAATGGTIGVVITWVDPHGAAARELRVTDVVESIDGQPTRTLEHWTARVARLAEGESVVIKVRHAGEVRDVRLVARGGTAQADRPLGLTLRTIPRIGAEVIRVEADSSAAFSGLHAGDVLTLVGDIEAPNAAQASRVFAAASRDRPVVVAVTRAGTHRVFVLERTW